MKDLILDISRQNTITPLTPWFDKHLDHAIECKLFHDEENLKYISTRIVEKLVDYRLETGKSTAVVGISGGVDSALTAALFKAAGWHVIGVLMPIHQAGIETMRGLDTCAALGIEQKEIDLSLLYDQTTRYLEDVDPQLFYETGRVKIRKGNIRARLRMITLYNLAAAHHGLVASTDNFSELAMGFWTLHGDVGDLSPIQSLYKSWEVPMLAKLNGVPEAVWRAKPTDGLGIAGGDEEQFGFSYLELDLMLMYIFLKGTDCAFDNDPRAHQVYSDVTERVRKTWFKRKNPFNVANPLENRYSLLEYLDAIFSPSVVR